MAWFTTIDHRGEAVEIASVEDMNAVVDAFEARLDQLALLLEGVDRDARRRAAAEYTAMAARRDRIEADIRKAEAHGQLASEDRYHSDLAHAIRSRTKS